MKALIAAALISIFSVSAFAQDIAETAVPSVVLNSFKGQYGDAQKADWEKKGDKFEVEFKQGTVDRAVLLDASGKVVAVKQEIALTELPATVASAIKQNYKSYDLEEAEKIEYNGATYYEVEVDRFFLGKELIFTADGKESKLPF